MQYAYTFVEDTALEIPASGAELPRIGGRVYVAARLLQKALDEATARGQPSSLQIVDPPTPWIEHRVVSVDRALDLAGERVRVVLGPPLIDELNAEIDRFKQRRSTETLTQAVVAAAEGEFEPLAVSTPDTKAPWDESDGRTISISAGGSLDPIETGASQAQTTPVLSLQDFADERGLTVTRPSDNHVQLRRAKKVIIEWWPSSGTVRAGNKRLADCADERAFVTLCAKEIE